MAIVKSPGLVLQRIPFSDSSLILKVYTSEHGLLTLMVKGARHPRSKFRALTDFFLVIQWVHPLSSRGEMLTLHDASLIEDLPSLRVEPIKQALAQTWLETYLRLSPAGGESQQRFDWLLQHLQSLDASVLLSETTPLSIDFLTGFCALSGFAPQFRHCVHCGLDIDLTLQPHSKIRMHIDLGGPICPACRPQAGDITNLSSEAALVIERIQSFGFKAITLRKTALQAAELFLWNFLDRHAAEGRRLKAYEVYRSLMNGIS